MDTSIKKIFFFSKLGLKSKGGPEEEEEGEFKDGEDPNSPCLGHSEDQ